MDIHYHKWLDIEVKNNYFTNGLCSIFSLVPFENTNKILTNYNILIHKKNHTFSFYIGVSGQKKLNLSEEFSELNNLYFQLVHEDSLFSNYTDIPLLEAKQLFFFKNSKNSSLLQINEKVSKDDLISIHQESFSTQVNIKTDTVEIKNKKGVTLQKQPDSDKKYQQVNLNNLASGEYQLWINGKQIESFYHFDTALSEKCFGILKLDLKEVIKAAQEVLKLSLQFESRAAYWQYQVIVPDSWNIEDTQLEVKDAEGNSYSGPIDKQIVSQKTAKVFTSSQPMGLKQHLLKNPVLSVTYSDTYSNRKNELEIKLPNPGIEELKIINIEGNENSFCSTSIVYV